jgi:hypothetical protein
LSFWRSFVLACLFAGCQRPSPPVARVGEVTLTERDLQRYRALFRPTASPAEALDELCDRTVLLLMAGREHLTPDPAVVDATVARELERLAPNPARWLRERGLSEDDLRREVGAETLAVLAQKQLFAPAVEKFRASVKVEIVKK